MTADGRRRSSKDRQPGGGGEHPQLSLPAGKSGGQSQASRDLGRRNGTVAVATRSLRQPSRLSREARPGGGNRQRVTGRKTGGTDGTRCRGDQQSHPPRHPSPPTPILGLRFFREKPNPPVLILSSAYSPTAPLSPGMWSTPCACATTVRTASLSPARASHKQQHCQSDPPPPGKGRQVSGTRSTGPLAVRGIPRKNRFPARTDCLWFNRAHGSDRLGWGEERGEPGRERGLARYGRQGARRAQSLSGDRHTMPLGLS